MFEEFVPREYRDQLTNPKKKRNALGFAVKQKQWKPAPTLNGKPYQTGMPPSSPAFRDSQFDAMLNDTKGVTRKISAGEDTNESWNSNPVTPAISAPLYTAPLPAQMEALSVTPTTPKRPSPSPRGAGSAGRSGGLSSRFKLGGPKRGTMGSEYDANLDFETRTASDGSEGSPDRMHPERSFGLTPSKKHSRRQSKDDAWVDILVADQGRRLREQDATFRGGKGLGGTMPFPTGSSSTVRRNRSNSDPDMHKSQNRMTYGDDEEDFTTTTAPIPVSPPAGYHSSDEEVMPIPRESSPDPAHFHPPPANDPAITPGRRSHETRYDDEPEDYEPESDFEPASDEHHQQAPKQEYENDLTTSSFPVSDGGYKEDDLTTSSLGQPVSPRLMTRRIGLNNPDRPVTAVSSLIDMYSERDAQAGAARPSRLPVRATSKGPALAEPIDVLAAPPIPPALEPGRASPSRYVHGAPLHNVMEEEDD